MTDTWDDSANFEALEAALSEAGFHGIRRTLSSALIPWLNVRLAEAWDEGAAKASPHGGAYLRSFYAENPYRDTGSKGD